MVMYEKDILRFHQAAALLPPEQRRALERLDDAVKARTAEIRLRAGQPVSLGLPEVAGSKAYEPAGSMAAAADEPADSAAAMQQREQNEKEVREDA